MPKLIDEPRSTTPPFAGMVSGETRVHLGSKGQMIQLTRTHRPFVFDWVDSTNDAHGDRLGDSVWIVGITGEPQLVGKKFARQMGQYAPGRK